MAYVLTLAKRDDGSADIDTLSLAGYTAGFDMALGGYLPQVVDASDPEAWLAESITLRLHGSSVDNVAALEQALQDKVRECQNWQDDAERYGVWLRCQATGETGGRQALLRKLRGKALSDVYTPQLESLYWIRKYALEMERKGLWEETSFSNYTATGLNLVGGMSDLTAGGSGAVEGDEYARLALTNILGVNGGGGPIERAWLGFRSTRHGTRANFQTYWSLRKSAAFDADTTGGTANADATAKDGYKTITTFATVATLLRRATIRCQDVTANYSDQRGTFTILLRAKNSAAGTVRVRLADGLYSNTTLRTQSRAVISSTSWKFYEMGTVTIPSPAKLFNATSYLQNYAMGIDAERISGACSLEMDCLVLIPIDEGFVYAEGMQVQYSGGSTEPCYIAKKADGRVDATQFISSVAVSMCPAKVSKGMPVGSVSIVGAGQRSTVSTLADNVTVDMYLYRRWKFMRGAE